MRLRDGRVLVAGGVDDWGGLAATQYFHPASNRWARGNDLPAERSGQVTVPLGDADGGLLLAGGQGWIPSCATTRTTFRFKP
ncbi:MAG: hypothetical protein GXX79_09840 [Actinomycetales bacterium]|nr:hypothetical protein [Actinomycetales bacterium]